MVLKSLFLFVSLSLSTLSLASDTPVFELEFNDGVVKPQTLKVPVGKKFKIKVKNIGKTAEEFESNELNREKIIAPNKTVTVFLGPLKKGEYKFFGEFHMDKKTSHGVIVAE